VAEVIGIGDTHLSKLTKIIPEADKLSIQAVRRVLAYAQRKGIKHIIFYGDIAEKPTLSTSATKLLLKLLFAKKYRELEFSILLGNHDFAEDGSHSLELIETVGDFFSLANVKVYTEPQEVSLDGVIFRLLPYPHTQTSKRVINVGHFEVQGAKRDNGRKVTEGIDNDHVCILGHLHTNHRVRNSYFSGTLYQTNFGETLPKFFHHIRANSVRDYEVSSIKFIPPWKLVNLEIATAKDIKQIKDEEHVYYKLFIRDGLDLDINQILQTYPNILKHNFFKNKEELELLLQEGWRLDEDLVEQTVEIDQDSVVNDLLISMGLSEDQLKRSKQIRRRLLER
jgi:DNA repair exonuclease SbcCD nuclease subunit